MITIDDAISELEKAKKVYGTGDVVLYVSLSESGIEPLEVDSFVLVTEQDGGATFEVRAYLPEQWTGR